MATPPPVTGGVAALHHNYASSAGSSDRSPSESAFGIASSIGGLHLSSPLQSMISSDEMHAIAQSLNAWESHQQQQQLIMQQQNFNSHPFTEYQPQYIPSPPVADLLSEFGGHDSDIFEIASVHSLAAVSDVSGFSNSNLTNTFDGQKSVVDSGYAESSRAADTASIHSGSGVTSRRIYGTRGAGLAVQSIAAGRGPVHHSTLLHEGTHSLSSSYGSTTSETPLSMLHHQQHLLQQQQAQQQQQLQQRRDMEALAASQASQIQMIQQQMQQMQMHQPPVSPHTMQVPSLSPASTLSQNMSQPAKVLVHNTSMTQTNPEKMERALALAKAQAFAASLRMKQEQEQMLMLQQQQEQLQVQQEQLQQLQFQQQQLQQQLMLSPTAATMKQDPFLAAGVPNPTRPINSTTASSSTLSHQDYSAETGVSNSINTPTTSSNNNSLIYTQMSLLLAQHQNQQAQSRILAQIETQQQAEAQLEVLEALPKGLCPQYLELGGETRFTVEEYRSHLIAAGVKARIELGRLRGEMEVIENEIKKIDSSVSVTDAGQQQQQQLQYDQTLFDTMKLPLSENSQNGNLQGQIGQIQQTMQIPPQQIAHHQPQEQAQTNQKGLTTQQHQDQPGQLSGLSRIFSLNKGKKANPNKKPGLISTVAPILAKSQPGPASGTSNNNNNNGNKVISSQFGLILPTPSSATSSSGVSKLFRRASGESDRHGKDVSKRNSSEVVKIEPATASAARSVSSFQDSENICDWSGDTCDQGLSNLNEHFIALSHAKLDMSSIQDPPSHTTSASPVSSSPSSPTGAPRRRPSSNAKGPGPFECPIPGCGKVLSRAHNLRSHVRTHTDDKPFSCTFCPLSFRRTHDLKRHMRGHTDEKPYLCENCGKGFARTDARARHIKMGDCIVDPSAPAAAAGVTTLQSSSVATKEPQAVPNGVESQLLCGSQMVVPEDFGSALFAQFHNVALAQQGSQHKSR